MENVLAVNMPKCQSELAEPVKDLLLAEFLASFGVFDFTLQIAILRIFRDDAEMFFVNKWFMILDDIWVVQGLQYFDFVIKCSLGFVATVSHWAVVTLNVLLIGVEGYLFVS